MLAFLKKTISKRKKGAIAAKGVSDLARKSGKEEMTGKEKSESSLLAAQTEKRKELEKLMDVYLKPPSYEQSLKEYEKYLSGLEKSNSFRANFFLKEMKEDRSNFAENEKKSVNQALFFGVGFVFLSILVTLSIFEQKLDSKIGPNKLQYCIALWKIKSLSFKNQMSSKEDFQKAVEFIEKIPPCFLSIKIFRIAFSKLANRLLDQKTFADQISKSKESEKCLSLICLALSKPEKNPDILTISCLIKLLKMLESKKLDLSQEATRSLSQLLKKSEAENPNTVFLHLAILRILARQPEHIDKEVQDRLQASSLVLSQLARKKGEELFSSLRYQRKSFQGFAAARINSSIQKAEKLTALLQKNIKGPIN